MGSPQLCSDDEIAALVHAFYGRVRRDSRLGPIFNSRVENWDAHLVKLTDFWSSILRGTGRFHGAPMTRHAALPGLSADLFEHWLALFRETAAEQPNRAMAEQACVMAQRIARSLWLGYQLSQRPGETPADLQSGDAPPTHAAPLAAA